MFFQNIRVRGPLSVKKNQVEFTFFCFIAFLFVMLFLSFLGGPLLYHPTFLFTSLVTKFPFKGYHYYSQDTNQMGGRNDEKNPSIFVQILISE